MSSTGAEEQISFSSFSLAIVKKRERFSVDGNSSSCSSLISFQSSKVTQELTNYQNNNKK